ncbi:hypothetical protein C1I97_14145 [Streptomyces sp. NTH33]|nr:hypothetical protein C1I97_14145 [Streptomyces sp. NTH33]
MDINGARILLPGATGEIGGAFAERVVVGSVPPLPPGLSVAEAVDTLVGSLTTGGRPGMPRRAGSPADTGPWHA